MDQFVGHFVRGEVQRKGSSDERRACVGCMERRGLEDVAVSSREPEGMHKKGKLGRVEGCVRVRSAPVSVGQYKSCTLEK